MIVERMQLCVMYTRIRKNIIELLLLNISRWDLKKNIVYIITNNLLSLKYTIHWSEYFFKIILYMTHT